MHSQYKERGLISVQPGSGDPTISVRIVLAESCVFGQGVHRGRISGTRDAAKDEGVLTADLKSSLASCSISYNGSQAGACRLRERERLLRSADDWRGTGLV